MKIDQIVRNLTEEENKPVDPSQVKPGTQVMPSAGETTTKAKKIEKVGPEGATIGTGDSAETKEVVPLTKLVPVEKQQGGQPAVAVAPDNEGLDKSKDDDMKLDELSRIKKLAGMEHDEINEAPAQSPGQADQNLANQQVAGKQQANLAASAKALDAAIRKFQTANKLTADGIIGPKTLAAMNAATKAPAQPPAQSAFAKEVDAMASAGQEYWTAGKPSGKAAAKPAPAAPQPVAGMSDVVMASYIHNDKSLTESQKIAALRELLTRLDEAPQVNYNPTGLAQVKDAQRAQQRQQAGANQPDVEYKYGQGLTGLEIGPTHVQQSQELNKMIMPSATPAQPNAAAELNAAIKKFQQDAGLPPGGWNPQTQKELDRVLRPAPQKPATPPAQKPAAPAAPAAPAGVNPEDLARSAALAKAYGMDGADTTDQMNQAIMRTAEPGTTPADYSQIQPQQAAQPAAPVRPVPKRPAAAPRQAVPQQDYLARMAARDSEAG